MSKRYRRVLIMSFLAAALTVTPALAYEIFLDIDIDNDPTTLNTNTENVNAVVKLILWPTEPSEIIGPITFGLGGECLGCPPNDINGVQTYGTSFDLPISGPWVTAPGYDSDAAYATYLGCVDNPGFHLQLSFEPQGGGTVSLNQPIFLAEFNAWVSDPVADGCTQPSSYLMAMPSQGQWWNYVTLGGANGPIPTKTRSWGSIKSVFR